MTPVYLAIPQRKLELNMIGAFEIFYAPVEKSSISVRDVRGYIIEVSTGSSPPQ